MKGLVSSLLFSSFLYAALPTAEDYVGPWEILIVNSASTFRSCSLDLTRKENALLGEMVWRWGSVWKITEPGIVKVNDKGDLVITRGDWSDPLTFKLYGDMIEGSVRKKDGTVYYLIGIRGTYDADLSGTWDVTITSPDREIRGALTFRNEGAGRWSGRAFNEYGEPVENLSLEEIRVAGERLKFKAVGRRSSGEKRAARVEAVLKGDIMEGKMFPGAGREPFKITGKRRRSWGRPVKLLRENGLGGWHARDPRQSFKWKCEKGVLTNDPPTSDIVSDLEFGDFKLHLEYKVAEHSNSGVYLRGRYEAQILDDYGKGVESHGNGAIYSRIPQKKNASKPPNTWQTYDITLIGRYVTVVLNGVTIVENEKLEGITGGALDPFESMPGPLMLQGDHGKVWFRNIEVRPAQ